MDTGYYDIHTHILPEVDDGSESLEESVEMLHIAYEQGVRHMVATPHFAADESNAPVEELKEKLELLRRQAERMDEHFTLELGNELLDGPGAIEALKEGRALTLAGTHYILVEFVPMEKYHKIRQSLHTYIMGGYIPVVAHMERYEALYKHQEYMEELIKMGCYFQMNTQSLQGGIFNRKASYHRHLVEDGYIHFLGSDCHGSQYRKPFMKDALRYFGKDALDEPFLENVLCRNPKAMLENRYIKGERNDRKYGKTTG